jgi:hypothetical protein
MLAMTLSSPGLGATAGEIATIIQKVGPYIDTLGYVVNDPAFPQLMARIKTLNEMEVKGVAGLGAVPPSQANVGIGLKWAVKGLDAVIFTRKNPWAAGLVGASIVLIIGSVGYAMGRRRR